jgi:predicted nucleic acid-binding Zn ribbon protein
VIRADRVIPAVLAQVLRDAPLCPEKIEFAWRSAVGPAVARVTNVRLEAGGVLHVRVDEAHWGREIRRSSRLILSRMAALLGTGVVRTLDIG